MSELMRNAWFGWEALKEPGKLVGLLLVLLIFLLIYREHEDLRVISWYTAAMTLLCICPLTAAVLMLYQTRFYDYQWIWSMVPVTIAVAMGLTVLVTDFYAYCRGKDKKYANILLVAVPIALFLCGGMGVAPDVESSDSSSRREAEAVLQQLKELSEDEKLCLWAPKEILEYAREYDGELELIYGRNMWEEALNAYTFDIYSEEQLAMYQWMDGESAKNRISDEACVELVIESGANCILLPNSASRETVACFSEGLGSEEVLLGNYYMWIL